MPDIDFVERCADCTAVRKRRAARMARRGALIGAAAVAAWTWSRPPTSPTGQWYAVIAIPVVAAIVYKIVSRVAWEVL